MQYGRVLGAVVTALLVAAGSYVAITAASGLPPGAIADESRAVAAVCAGGGTTLGVAYYRDVHPRLARG